MRGLVGFQHARLAAGCHIDVDCAIFPIDYGGSVLGDDPCGAGQLEK
jgi:hypothetical protein